MYTQSYHISNAKYNGKERERTGRNTFLSLTNEFMNGEERRARQGESRVQQILPPPQNSRPRLLMTTASRRVIRGLGGSRGRATIPGPAPTAFTRTRTALEALALILPATSANLLLDLLNATLLLLYLLPNCFLKADALPLLALSTIIFFAKKTLLLLPAALLFHSSCSYSWPRLLVCANEAKREDVHLRDEVIPVAECAA